jgi:hypothetical protein
MASIPEDASARSAAEEQQAERAVGAGRQPEPEQSSIGELAKLAAVSTRTIRYYEELGILPARARRPAPAATRVPTCSTSRVPKS